MVRRVLGLHGGEVALKHQGRVGVRVRPAVLAQVEHLEAQERMERVALQAQMVRMARQEHQVQVVLLGLLATALLEPLEVQEPLETEQAEVLALLVVVRPAHQVVAVQVALRGHLQRPV